MLRKASENHMRPNEVKLEIWVRIYCKMYLLHLSNPPPVSREAISAVAARLAAREADKAVKEYTRLVTEAIITTHDEKA